MELIEKLDLFSLGLLPDLIQDYLKMLEKISTLSTHSPSLTNIREVIRKKQGFPHRKRLHKTLKNQYKNAEIGEKTKQHLDLLLDENTFTVCTAHQLCLFTGPHYFIFKILSAIQLAKQLNEQHPDKHFIPVYWMGDEDHDFEEINHCYLYGKKIEWQTQQSGAVGRMSLEGLEKSIHDLEEILGESKNEKDFISTLRKYFTNREVDYGTAFQEWILDLFKTYGLIVVRQDDKTLKESFIPIIENELTHQNTNSILSDTTHFLENEFTVQAFPRKINLFYLNEGRRERIEALGDTFKLVDSGTSFSLEKLISLLYKYPERFSPNVILRPLYQEYILPNVAFLGGPGELSYWLELNALFKERKIPQPLLLLRNIAVLIPEKDVKKIYEWQLQIHDIFKDYDVLAKNLVVKFSDNELNLQDEKKAIEELFSTIKSKVTHIDKTLERSVAAEEQKVLKSLQNLEQKIVRAEKRQYDLMLSQLERLKNKIFPDGILQERHDNFIPQYTILGNSYFEKLLNQFNIEENKLYVFKY